MGRQGGSIDPRTQLEYFVYRVNRLVESDFVRSRFSPKFSLNFNRVAGRWSNKLAWREPDPEALDSFLMHFRVFTMRGEPTYVADVVLVCGKHLRNERLLRYLFTSLQFWRDTLTKAGIKLIFNGKELQPIDIYHLWLYSGHFHTDPEKIAQLQALMPMGAIHSRQLFFDMLLSGLEQLIYIRNVIVAALHAGEFDFP